MSGRRWCLCGLRVDGRFALVAVVVGRRRGRGSWRHVRRDISGQERRRAFGGEDGAGLRVDLIVVPADSLEGACAWVRNEGAEV